MKDIFLDVTDILMIKHCFVYPGKTFFSSYLEIKQMGKKAWVWGV